MRSKSRNRKSMAFEAMRFEELLKKVSTDDTERQSKRERDMIS